MDFKPWGTVDLPAHKSDLNQTTGDYACTRRLAFELDARCRGEFSSSDAKSGKAAAGTAVHEVIRRVLQVPGAMDSARKGGAPSRTSLSKTLWEEWDHATQGRQVRWSGRDTTRRVLAEREQMLVGLFADLHHHIHQVELAEAGFIAPLGDHWIEGHVDLIYRPSSDPTSLALTDWKTGREVPHPFALDQGWEGGLYSAALRYGAFVPEQLARDYEAAARELPESALAIYGAPNQRERMHEILRAVGRRMQAGRALPSFCVQFGEFPAEIWLTHLMDYLPYKKAGNRFVHRPEELAFYNLEAPASVAYDKGERRGPGWYRVRRTEADLPRLERLVAQAIRMMHQGAFLPFVGKKCVSCPFREQCFAEGYELAEDDLKNLDGVLTTLGANDDGLGAVEGL